MFNNNKNEKANFEKINTLIGVGASLESAVFYVEGTIRIDGTYNGKLNVNGDLVISETGVVKGDVEVNHALIAGKITGNIICKNEIHLSSTALVEGNINCANLVVDNGGKFNGNCVMTGNAAASAASSAVVYEKNKEKENKNNK